MFTVANNIRNARLKGREYTSAKVEKMEFENLGEGGVIKVLNLLHDEFTYDIELIENPREYEDRASLFLTWSNHFEF